MTIPELNTEIAQLEKDLVASPETDKPIIQEEIDKLKAQVVELEKTPAPAPTPAPTTPTPTPTAVATPQDTAVAELSPEEQELMKEARQETGEGTRLKYPSAPKIKVDNQKTKKLVDGEELEGKPLQRFIHVHKEGEGWITDDLGATLNGVILKVRRQIREKFDEGNPTKQRFQSYEYTQGDLMRVFTGQIKTPTIIFQGSEAECIEEFSTGEMNTVGKPKVNYDKFALIYMLVKKPEAEEPELIKFETKISVKDHPIWDYLFSFGENDTFLAWQSNLTLEWIEATAVAKFWRPVFARGPKVELKESLKYLKELNKLFDVMDGKTKGAPVSEAVPLPDEEPPLIDGPGGEDYSQPEEDEIKVDDIPF